MKTTVICNDWQDMYLDHMTDEEAGRLFKIMLSLRNGRDVEIPADFKFIMTHIQKFWNDQDESYKKFIDQRKQAALSRWHKSDANDATVCDRIHVDASSCITNTITNTITDNRTNNKLSSINTSTSSVERKKTKKIPVINHYSSEFESFW